jgi:hypothetical protein
MAGVDGTSGHQREQRIALLGTGSIGVNQVLYCLILILKVELCAGCLKLNQNSQLVVPNLKSLTTHNSGIPLSYIALTFLLSENDPL